MTMSDAAQQVLHELVAMSLEIGRPERDLVILGEGNTSADVGDGSFWVKASGTQLPGTWNVRVWASKRVTSGSGLSNTTMAKTAAAASQVSMTAGALPNADTVPDRDRLVSTSGITVIRSRLGWPGRDCLMPSHNSRASRAQTQTGV